MQITQGTFDQFAAPGEKISNTTDNKDVGNRILASYWKRYNGDAARAAVAYYSGPETSPLLTVQRLGSGT